MTKSMKVRPVTLTITMSDGSKVERQFADFKPSKASGRLNATAVDKIVIDGKLVQLGCNLTVIA